MRFTGALLGATRHGRLGDTGATAVKRRIHLRPALSLYLFSTVALRGRAQGAAETQASLALLVEPACQRAGTQ